MKHPSVKVVRLTESEIRFETVRGGQFKWGACLLKSNGGA